MPASSLETDLRDARNAQGLSLEDIQSETRIPVHILRQFEEGRLVGDATYSPVYLRAFLKAYAKAVGLSQSDVLAQYDASQSPGRKASPAPTPSTPPKDAPPRPALPQAPAAPGPEPEPMTPEKVVAPVRPPAVVATSPSRESTAGAISGARVSRPPVPSARRSFDKNWGTIIGLFVAVVAVLAAALWFLVIRDPDPSGPSDEIVEQEGGNPVAIDSVGVGAGAGSNAPQLQMPIEVTVYAAGNGLQSFRVTAEPEDRRPFWVEVGQSETFTSDQAVILWGEGEGDFSDAVVELQGQRWTPTGAGPVRIDAARGQQLLDSLSTRPPGSIPAVPGAPAPAE